MKVSGGFTPKQLELIKKVKVQQRKAEPSRLTSKQSGYLQASPVKMPVDRPGRIKPIRLDLRKTYS